MKQSGVAVVLCALLASTPAGARSVRFVVAIGNAVGDPGDPPLRYAESDVDRFVSVFVDIGGTSSSRVYRLVNESLPAIREGLSEVSGRMTELVSTGDQAELFLYVSAHASKGVLHLQGSHWPLAELRAFVERAPARIRVLFVDSCDSGQAIRPKGTYPAPDYDVQVSSFPLSGTVVVSSSGPAEPSQEWDSLGGSLFTHFLLTGLRGDADADRDGKVTMAEVYAYTFKRTVANSSALAQHPALEVVVAGSGELVLTQPVLGKGALVFPAELSGRFLVTSEPRPDVVAELDKAAGQPLHLAVPPGRYLLRKNEGKSVALMRAELPFGGRFVIDDSSWVRRHYAEVTLKGGDFEVRPNAVVLGAVLDTGPVANSGARWGGSAQYRRTVGPWWAMAGFHVSGAGYSGGDLRISELDFGATVAGGYRWLAFAVIPHLGLSLQALAVHQTFSRTTEARILANGYPSVPTATAVGVAGGPIAALEVPLGQRFFAILTGGVWVQYLPIDRGPQWQPKGRAQAEVGVRF